MNTIQYEMQTAVYDSGKDVKPEPTLTALREPRSRAARLVRKVVVTGGAGLLSLSVLLLLCGLAFPSGALAWDDCPKGLVNDPYPGRCGRYVDTNGDQICDLSQPRPVTTTTLATAVSTVTTGEPPTGDCPLGPCLGCGACFGLGVPATLTQTVAAATQTDGTAMLGGGLLTSVDAAALTTDAAPAADDLSTLAASEKEGVSFMTHYLISPIALGFFVIYGTSFLLYKTKRMRVTTHRKIWNVLLLGTFLVTGIFGVILAIQLDYSLPFEIPIDLLFWHVEAGIAMTFISLFHLGWHFNYYRNLLRRTRRQARQVRESERAPAFEGRRLVTEARQSRRGVATVDLGPLATKE